MKKVLSLLILVVLILVAVSIVMIYSTSGILAQDKFGNENYFLVKQLSWLGLSFCAFLFFSYCPFRILKPLSMFFILTAIILLSMTMFGPFSHTAGGATRWIVLGPIRFQPSEFAKIAVIIYLADVLSRKQDKIKEFFKSLFFPSLLIGFVLFLVLQQPDLGTTVLLALIALFVYLIAGMKMTYFFLFVVKGCVMLVFLIKMFPYRMKRISAFLDPFKDPRGSGFQIIQSFIALGSGGLKGVGLGQGKQKLFYLPEAHTDFIFAIIGEELGFLGTVSVVLLFLTLCACGIMVAYKCKDQFGKLLVIGFTLMISIQALINMCVVTGMMPTKGISLPFVSFGGSNLLINFIAIGIIVNVGLKGNDRVESNIIKQRKARKDPVRYKYKRLASA